LRAKGIVLPEPPKPIASYVPVARAGDLLFLSGNLPLKEGKLLFTGKVPTEVSLPQAQEASRQAVLNLLSILNSELQPGEEVERIVRLTGYVASDPGFTAQPQVVNGASEFLVEVFGEAGKHSREAVGVVSLPLNSPVEISMVVKIRKGEKSE